MTTKTSNVRQIRSDLWETRTDNPFPGLTTHAYLWVRPEGNVLFYSPATEADFEAIAELGGVAHQYLSHQDEAGPMLAVVKQRFGSKLHASAREEGEISTHTDIDVPTTQRQVDENGVEVIPTPGHSVGSTSYLVTGADGEKYLFTGDTMFPTEAGSWSTFLVPGRGSADELSASLDLLADTVPNVVISSAYGGDTAVYELTPGRWGELIAQARQSLQRD
ncbi:MBL fold metallo-hydrolase [Mycobacteroides chelonae]|uniref:MBL fold metallo-hydrolase n=1 Tax=Mycobacteroides chelonae TaxID=1774 RepID=UPI0008A8E600|nr:MBL fold metallo-hydrolase [Mycobacteroides chelonae]MBF9352071.1 MBL fold metallo-hydrolase [Mycobacteroides chelonae]OHU39661.1 MBL fold metallo-hydrolase [Mycobacteroides chelonae]OHU50885.1 MBL fold metallo-hydrolase [Mycobacteroides chelonae]